MGRQAGVSGSTIRGVEKHGVIPHLTTQDRIASFLGLDKSDIWCRDRRPIRKRQPPSRRIAGAVTMALSDRDAGQARLAMGPEEGFAFGVAWAVSRAQNPYADPVIVTERALIALREAWAS